MNALSPVSFTVTLVSLRGGGLNERVYATSTATIDNNNIKSPAQLDQSVRANTLVFLFYENLCRKVKDIHLRNRDDTMMM